MSTRPLKKYLDCLHESSSLRWQGHVTQIVGNLVESAGPLCSVGECCEIVNSDGVRFSGEVVGFRGATVLSMPLERPEGLRLGNSVFARGTRPSVRVGPDVIGRVIDGQGMPIDSPEPYRADQVLPIASNAPLPLERVPIRDPLPCGIRAIDGFLTCGRGQRVGIFGGSGVGKTTLIGMMTRGTAADLTVVALIGERGREVGDFLDALGEEGRRRSVVVVSTSDQSPLLRIRAALVATTIAEYFCREGKHVLLVLDSITRFAMAQRELGLAAGEPPTTKGYTPSVLNVLARLVERAGPLANGSITAFYTALMESDDQNDPIVDTVRSLLDGHIVLDRALASQNHYPPIAVLDSLSRLMPNICSEQHSKKVKELRQLLSIYQRSEDLIRIGAYKPGSDSLLDRAILTLPGINQFLQQASTERVTFPDTVKHLQSLAG